MRSLRPALLAFLLGSCNAPAVSSGNAGDDATPVSAASSDFAASSISAAPDAAPPAPDANVESASTFATTTEALDATEGATLFRRWCVPCHGVEGRGDGITASRLDPQPKDLAASCGIAASPDSRLDLNTIRDVITRGARPLGRVGVMPAFGTTLAPHQVNALATYVRCLGPQGP